MNCPSCKGQIEIPSGTSPPLPPPPPPLPPPVFSFATVQQVPTSAKRRLTTCRDCGHAITSKATSCPACGAPVERLRFACPSCGQHISATRAQIGVTAPCPNCNAPVTVPKTSTLAPPPPAPLQTKFREKKRYETTVILIDDSAVPTTSRKLKKWTDDLTDARNWLLRQLGGFPGDRYFAGIFDHKEKRSVFKEKGDENRT